MIDQELNHQIDEFVNKNKENFLIDLNKIISINSVKAEPFGDMRFGKGCGEALNTMLQMGEENGFHAKNGDYYYGILSIGDENNALGMITHLDVVPAGEGWAYPPFALTVENGYCLGRGVEDDKGPALTAFYAMRFIKEHNLKMKHGIKLVLGCDEESGMSDIHHFLKHEPLPAFSFTPDAEYPVCNGEKGIFEANLEFDNIGKTIVDFQGGVASNVVAANAYVVLKNYSKQSLTAVLKEKASEFTIEDTSVGVKITAIGVSAHAATPEKGTSAIGMLVSLLCDYSLADSSELLALQFINTILCDYKGSGFNIQFEDEPSGYTTCIGGIIKKEADKLLLNVNIRYAISQNGEDLAMLIETACQNHNAKLFIHCNSKPHHISADTPVIKALTDISNTILKTDLKSYVMGGGTYARNVPNCVAFGPNDSTHLKPFPLGTGDVHQPNEAANLELMLNSIKIFIYSLLAMDKLV